MLINLFKRTFDIRDGEIRISFFMQLYIFLLITVLLMVKPTVNALFLSKLGAKHLPYGYMLVAVVAIIVSYFYNKGVKQYSLKRITTGTLIFFSLIFALLSFLMYIQSINNWVLYGYYLSVSIFAVLVTSQFWIIANMVYNAREAKRLFGFIGAGAIAGGIFGGYLTTILATSFGNRIVILVAALLIICCVPILETVWKLRVEKLNLYIRKQRKGVVESTYASPFKLIISSKHLTYLAAIVGVGVVMAKLVDFQFSDFAHKAIPDSDELASFFGFWFSSFNVIALLIQLFFTNRLLAWLGVTTNLLILPLSIAIGCLLFLTFPELWVLVIIKGMDGSFKQSINKAGVELSILPIPSHIKNEAKSYIDVVVDSIATGLAGLLLIFVVGNLALSTSYITVIILLFLFAWIVLIYKLREAYFQSFRSNIQGSFEGASVENRNLKFRKTSKSTINVLTQGNESEILTMLTHLQDFKLYTFRPHIVNLLKHESPQVKAAAISQLHHYKKGTAVEYVKELVHYKNDEVVYEAIHYLLHHTDLKGENIIKTYLDHPTDYISNAALLCLAKDASSNKKLAQLYNLGDRLGTKIKELFAEENELRNPEIAELMLAVGYARDPRFYSFISANFNNRDSYLVKSAIRAAGLTMHEPFVNELLGFLAEKHLRKTAIKALRGYGVGITKKVLQLELSERLPDKIKPYIPELIQSFGTRESVKVLMRFLKSKDLVIRTEAAKSLNTLKLQQVSFGVDQRLLTKILLKESTFYRNTLHAITSLRNQIENTESDGLNTDVKIESVIAKENLLDILLEQLEQSLEYIFKLFSLKYNQADIDTAYFGLKSEKQDVQVNGIEFLDNLLKSKLKSNILPLIEYHILESHGYSMSSFEPKIKLEKDILTMLLRNRGTRMKLAVLNVIKFSEDTSYISLVRSFTAHPNLELRRFAIRTLTELKMLAIDS